jgi:RNA polymerase sigma factor (sigma-70 family)
MATFDESFDELYRTAFRGAYKLLGDYAEAEDIAQEASARALAHWRKVEDYACAWVARVATNLALDRVRSHAVSRRADVIDLDAAARDPEAEERLDLQRALHDLPRRQRDVVVLRYLLDQPEHTVAAALGVSVGSVKTHASRGLSALRLSLGEGVASGGASSV